MAPDQEKKPAAQKAPAKKTVAKKQATKTTAAKKSTPAKGVDVKKATTAKPSAPLKAGATRAASSKSSATSTSNATGDLKDRAIDKVRSTANDGKAKAGEAIGSLSAMIENSAKSIDENVGEKYGDYARSAADAVSSFAEKVNAKDVDEMVDDARNFVRKRPAVAIGAAAVVGLLISRLIKSGMDDRS